MWNIVMSLFCMFLIVFAVNKISEGEISIGILLCTVSGIMIPMHFKACCSVFCQIIYIYEDRVVYKSVSGHKVVKFSNAFMMVNCPKYAGGKVLYFTESGEQNSFINRLITIFLIGRVMIIHIWMLSDSDYTKLEKLLSDLSRRPEFTFQSIGGLQPFYLPNRSEAT